MLFVVLCKVRGGTSPERTARRLEYQYPEGATVIAEYWLQTTDPAVVVIVECDSVAPMMATIGAWDDVFDVSVFPAVTAEEGMQLARQMMQG